MSSKAKLKPCQCEALSFPHRRNLNCDMLADDERIAQRDYEQEVAADSRERAADINEQRRNPWKQN